MSISLGNTNIGKICLFEEEDIDYLSFTAETGGSTLKLTKIGSPTEIELETSVNGLNWDSYTIGNTITLQNVGDKIYFRNKGVYPTSFSTSDSNYYQFVMTGKIAAGGHIGSLLCKYLKAHDLPGRYCFFRLFYNCSSLTTPPKLPYTYTQEYCYYYMFYGCSSLIKAPALPSRYTHTYCYGYMFSGCTALVELPKLPATTLATYCYYRMFNSCSGIKLSTTQTDEYTKTYRIPYDGSGTAGTYALNYTFTGTGGTFKGTPAINTTYYTSNNLV